MLLYRQKNSIVEEHNMKKPVKIILSSLAVCAVASAAVVGAFVIKPQLDIKKNHDKLTISDCAEFGGGDCIHFLNTDSSDAILIESDGHFALIDCAEDSDNPRDFEELVYRGYENEVLEFVRKKAADKNGKVYLDFVLGTHSHSDHIGGFDTLILADDIEIGRAYLKEYDETKIIAHEVEKWDNKEVYTQMLDALNSKNIPVISDITEKEFTLGNFNITLLNTEYDESGTLVGENDNAIGVLVEKDGHRAFLAADIDNITGDEDRLGPEIGKVDLLKVGHHSYSKSTSTNWLKNLDPDVCVVTNLYEKTDKRTLRRITRVCGSPILTTGGENGITVLFGENGLEYYNNI